LQFIDLSDVEPHSIRRLTIRRQLFVLCSPSEATGNQFAGRRSEAIVFVVHCSGIELRTAIKRTTDFKPECVIVFCVPHHGPSDDQLAGR